MNTFSFKKSTSYLFKLGFIALAVLGLSFAAQAGTLGVVSSDQINPVLVSDLSSQSEALQSIQSVQPSCGEELASSEDLLLEGTDNTNCTCCAAIGLVSCCLGCHIDDDDDASVDIDAS